MQSKIAVLILIFILMFSNCGENSSNPESSLEPQFGSIEGYVGFILTNAPISNAEVICGDQKESTNSNGYFKLERIPIGLHTLTCKKEGFSLYLKEIELLPDILLKWDILMSSDAILYGTVFDDSSGTPLPNVKISVMENIDYTDFSGKYLITNIPTGLQSLFATHNEYEEFASFVHIPNNKKEFNIGLEYALPILTNPSISDTFAWGEYRNYFVKAVDNKKDLTVSFGVIAWDSSPSPIVRLIAMSQLPETNYYESPTSWRFTPGDYSNSRVSAVFEGAR